MPTVEVAGASLEYVECGSDNPLVFVHGGASDYRTSQRQIEAFGMPFRAVAYSRRYHWPNAKIADGASYALSEQVSDLKGLLRALDAAPAHLVGHSYGVLACLALAIQSPNLVRTLVLAEPPVLGLFVSIPPKPLEIIKLAARSPRTAAGIMKLGALGLGPATTAFNAGDSQRAMRLVGTAILGRQAFEELDETRAGQVRNNLMKEELNSLEFMPPIDPEEVRNIRIPVLLVGADRSPRVFARLLDHLERLLPNSERVSIVDASHLMHEDNPPAFNASLQSFLAKHAAAI